MRPLPVLSACHKSGFAQNLHMAKSDWIRSIDSCSVQEHFFTAAKLVENKKALWITESFKRSGHFLTAFPAAAFYPPDSRSSVIISTPSEKRRMNSQSEYRTARNRCILNIQELAEQKTEPEKIRKFFRMRMPPDPGETFCACIFIAI